MKQGQMTARQQFYLAQRPRARTRRTLADELKAVANKCPALFKRLRSKAR